jgi:hypothetical protein
MVRGSSIAKLRQASHFVQMRQRVARKGNAWPAAVAHMGVPIVRKNWVEGAGSSPDVHLALSLRKPIERNF